MIIGSEKLVEWVKANNTPYWRILQNEKGGVIIASDVRDNLTLDDSILRLEQAVKMISSGNYFVDAWYQGLNQNSRYKTRFVMNASDGIGTLQHPTQQPIPDVQSEIAKALSDYKRELEVERLRIENTELHNQVNSSTHKILNRLEPYMGTIVEGLFPNARGIAGTGKNSQEPNTNTVEMIPATQEEQSKLESALGDWSEKDADFIKLIEKISKLSKDDPETYNMAKTMLMQK